MVENTEHETSRRARELVDKGLSAMERNNFDYAIDMFVAALETDWHFIQARKLLRVAGIKRLTASGGGSITRAKAMIAGIPLLIKGFIAMKTGKHIKALGIAEKLLAQDPFNLLFIRLLCEAAEAAGIPQAAIDTLVLARERLPDNIELLTLLGKLYTTTNQMQEAQTCFEKVVSLRPNDGLAMRALKDAMARDSMSKGGWQEGSTQGGSYRNMIKDKNDADMLEQEDKTVKDEKNIEMLINEAERKLMETPDDIKERRVLANLYIQANRFDAAIRILKEAQSISGMADPAIDQLLATIRVKEFDYEIEKLRVEGNTSKAATLKVERQEFLFNNVEARVKRYPNDFTLRYEYGILLYERKQFNEAIQQLQMAERNPSQRVLALYYTGLCFKEKQQFDIARDQLEKAASGLVEMDKVKKDIYYQLGQVLESMGELKQAVDQYYKPIYQVDIGFLDVAEKIENAYKKIENI